MSHGEVSEEHQKYTPILLAEESVDVEILQSLDSRQKFRKSKDQYEMQG